MIIVYSILVYVKRFEHRWIQLFSYMTLQITIMCAVYYNNVVFSKVYQVSMFESKIMIRDYHKRGMILVKNFIYMG